MKKLLIVLLLVFAVFGISSQTLTVLHSGDYKYSDGTTFFGRVETLLRKDFPNVKVSWMKIDLTDGSTLTMDAMLAAGEAPNVYLDTTVRTSKYMVPEYALDLTNLIRDKDKYIPGDLDPYYINGKLLGVPVAGSGQGMCINLDMMKDIGFTVKDDWSIDDFLVMAEKVKKFYNGKKWATGMFAANQSGDYLINNWYASFGVKWYENGNYSKPLVAKNGGTKVYEFYQKLVKNGYVPPNSAMLNDDDYCADWAAGKYAATAFFPSWTKDYLNTAISQKLIDKPFEFKFVPFPRATGVTKVGAYFSGSVAVAHKTGTNIDMVSARLAEYLNNVEIENLQALDLNITPDKIASIPPKDEKSAQISAIIAKNGIHDFGLTDRRFTERRALQFPILQLVLSLKITPEEASKKFEDALNSVK